MIGVIKYRDKSLNALCLWMLDNNIEYQIINADDIFMHDDIFQYSRILYDTSSEEHIAIKKFGESPRKKILLNVKYDINYVINSPNKNSQTNKIVVFMDNIDSNISEYLKTIILPQKYIENLIIFNWQQKHPQNAGWIDYKDKVEFLQNNTEYLITHKGFFSSESALCGIPYFDADQPIDSQHWTKQKKQPTYFKTITAEEYYEQYVIQQ